MENPIVLEYCETVFDKMGTDGLLGEDGELLFQSEEDFCRYCEQILF